MKVETQTPWVGVENFSHDYVHPEYIPAIAKLADRYGIPVRSHTLSDGPEWLDPLPATDRRVLLTIGDYPRVLELTPQQSHAFSREFVFLANYPG